MPHISHWELNNWNSCPFRHKLIHIDKIDSFKRNEYLAFGIAVHNSCEKLFLDKQQMKKNPGRGVGWITPTTVNDFFIKEFARELKKVKEEKELDRELVLNMVEQGKKILPLVLDATLSKFPGCSFVSAEEGFNVPIDGNEFEYNFKGKIDLVLKTVNEENEDVYHVIDWKTCSWGWDARKRTDKMTTYQLTYYKHFFGKVHGIEPKNINTYFALLKRTAKKDNVEFVENIVGAKKIQNALELANNAIKNINNKMFIKNRLSCSRCEFKKTIHCP